MSQMTISQQKTAAHYTIQFLKQSIPEVKAEIKRAEGNLKDVLEQRLYEMERELEEFIEIKESLD